MEDFKFNPPAFPTDSEHQPQAHVLHFEGMTLRDYFAAKAMQGDWAVQGDGDYQPAFRSDEPLENLTTAAVLYYRMADAMLAARNGGKEAA